MGRWWLVLVGVGCATAPETNGIGAGGLAADPGPVEVWHAEGQDDGSADAGNEQPDAAEEAGNTEWPLRFEQTAMAWLGAGRVAVSYDGGESLLGMDAGQSCEWDPDQGYLGEEDDCDEDEDIPLSYDATGASYVTGAVSESVHIRPPNVYRNYTIEVPGLRQAVVADEGFVATRFNDGCSVGWYTQGLDSEVALDDTLCAGNLAVVRSTKELLVANGDLWSVLPTGASLIAEGVGDLVDYDPASNGFVAATAGDSVVSGLGEDGRVLWTADQLQPVQRVLTVGPLGAYLVHSAPSASAMGTFRAYDSLSGELIGEAIAFGGIVDLEISADGSTMVVTTSNTRVYGYRVTRD